MGIARLRVLGIHKIEALAIISEESMKPLCDRYGVQYCFYKNEPLGEKKNFGLREARKLDFDYMVEIGSDDILKDGFLNVFDWVHPVYGLNDFIIINSETGACRVISGSNCRYGTGRSIRKDCLPEKLWTDKLNRRLDNNSTATLARSGVMERRVSSKEPLSIDLKSKENIWPYQPTGKKYSLELALSGLSDEEKKAICSLQKQKSEGVTV